jgi:hypothetical protein
MSIYNCKLPIENNYDDSLRNTELRYDQKNEGLVK